LILFAALIASQREAVNGRLSVARTRAPIAGDVFLRALAEHGVDFFFANPGTDFPPVVEAFSRARAGNAPRSERDCRA
jgi:hypothetical protein